MPESTSELNALASHLAARRQPLLQAWKAAVSGDPRLTTASSLPRRQFYDHIPDILRDFQSRLRAASESEGARAQAAGKKDASAHGLQRWQQGYRLHEVTREWGHLHLCVAIELEDYARQHPGADPAAMALARRVLIELMNEGVSESAGQYFHLRQVEAAGYVRDVEQALEQLRELERARAELWRQAAHDLRGDLGVVMNASEGLATGNVPPALREQFSRLLQRSFSSLHSMLDDVMSLARLQAGHESVRISPVDAGELLTDLCDALRPVARERGLYLKSEGPASLVVDGDPVKLRRIAQNLLLNAIKYTDHGGITVGWGDSRDGDSERWMLCVEDTGPGFHAGPGAPLAGALEAATHEARHVDERPDQGAASQGVESEPTSSRDTRPVHQQHGEGIGLSIVKRLCELLDAAIEVESQVAEGTTFRVVFPRSYRSSSPA
jgi:signal transduction histidine kinase